MKTRLPGNFFTSPLLCSVCLVLFVTVSGCASTSIPINPSESTDTVSYVSVKKGDHILIKTKDDRYLNMIVTGINSERQTITGRPISKGKYSDYEPLVVYFSEIESVEHKPPLNAEYWERSIFPNMTVWAITLIGLFVLFPPL